MTKPLSLAEAKRLNTLQKFVVQETKRGVSAADKMDFERAVGEAIKPRQSEDQT